MEHIDADGDDMFNTVCGDLGLGNVRRNNVHLKYDSNNDGIDENLIPLYHLTDAEELGSSPSDVRFKIQDFIKKGIIGSVLSRSHTYKNINISDQNGLESSRSEEVFPTYADVPYGTSYRQQKKLYEQQMGHLRQQQNAMTLLDNSSSPKNMDKKGKDKQVILTAEELDREIQHAMQEMDELKLELDACCKRLDAKYQAVAILKKQAEVANSDLLTSERRCSENNKRLEKEVNKLQFELEWRESSFMDSQQTWAERFDRVCRDNSLLMTKLEERNEEMRRVVAHKAAIARERDELLALLDVTERMKYEQGKSMIDEEEYGSFTSTELAVLGACKCRGANPEPCGCAHAAANLRKEVVKLREEMKEINKRRQEAYLTVDAYRLAFEEQMAKSRQMSQQLANLSTLTSRSVKAKAAMKFLLKSLSSDDEEFLHSKAQHDKVTNTSQDKTVMSLQELVQCLTDVVHEKEEALAQQKLAAQVLANKLNTLEKQVPPCLLDPDGGLRNDKENKCPSRSISVEDGSAETSRDRIFASKTVKEGEDENCIGNDGSELQQTKESCEEEHDVVGSDIRGEICSSDVIGCDREGKDDDDDKACVQKTCCDVIHENGVGEKFHHDHNRNERESIGTEADEATDNLIGASQHRYEEARDGVVERQVKE